MQAIAINSFTVPGPQDLVVVELSSGTTTKWYVGQILTFTTAKWIAHLKVVNIRTGKTIEVTGVDGKDNPVGQTLVMPSIETLTN